MPDPITGLIVGGTSLASGAIQSRSASKAAGAQVAASEMGIEEQRRQFDVATELLRPYVESGLPALQGLQNLAGLGEEGAQAAAIRAIEQGPEFQALTRQGEEAILQQAAATGGLRGGNVQGALAQFRPQVLSQLINQQYGRLGGISAIGQASAAGQAAQATQFGQNIAQGYSDIGAARAGGSLAQGRAWGNVLGDVGQMTGYLAGRGITF
jgi:curli biogenesis system outer membrane secretion channel CsgG